MQKKKEYIELLSVGIISLLFTLMCDTLVHDEVWNYGFAYNIASGLIPYKDFNMVITPLFPLAGALFMFIFGKSMVVYHIFNAIICTGIFYYMKKFIPKAYYIPYIILITYALPNYNLTCILFLYILMTMEDKGSNDYLIGIVLGLTFLTKQSIGIFLCIPTLFTKDFKKIIKRIIGFIIPNIIILIYLICTDSLIDFIDYCFLGIGSFGKENTKIYTSPAIILILAIIYLIYEYIKKKDIKIIYLLCFYIVTYPIIEPYHIIIPLIPTIGYLVNTLNLNKKIISFAFIIFIVMIFIYNFYNYSTDKYNYPNSTNTYKYRKINSDVENNINIFTEYIKKNNKNVFIIDMYAYLIKLNAGIPINKYDLLNDGNLGKNGQYKIIAEFDELCKHEECTFLLDVHAASIPKYSQYNQEIYDYIMNNYHFYDNVLGLSIYKNN